MPDQHPLQILVVGAEGAYPADAFRQATGNSWNVSSTSDYRTALHALKQRSIDAVIMTELPAAVTDDGNDAVAYEDLVRYVQGRHIAAILLTDNPVHSNTDGPNLVDSVRRDVSVDELRGRIATIERYHAVLKRLEQELHKMEHVGQRLNRHFEQVDQEMSLAGRLQRDFLPRLDKPIGNVRFATIYRPASWVSGDMFDVVRINEHQVGVYVADAVGHGMAAGLLTMFIECATVPKRFENGREFVLSPSEVVSALNDALVDQGLPSCQFVTAGYALLDQRTLTLSSARGGHPHPILIRVNGAIEEIESTGGLLGVFKGEEFPSVEVQLFPGDKVLFYTDGVELAFQAEEVDSFDTQKYWKVFRELAALPIDAMLREIERRLNAEAGSLEPRDDITIVGMEALST